MFEYKYQLEATIMVQDEAAIEIRQTGVATPALHGPEERHPGAARRFVRIGTPKLAPGWSHARRSVARRAARHGSYVVARFVDLAVGGRDHLADAPSVEGFMKTLAEHRPLSVSASVKE
jgi:hypothetical protein